MTTTAKIGEWLEQKGASFEVIAHPKRFTALETAEAEHVSGHSVAKVVMVKAKGRDVMIVIPADRKLDLFKTSLELETNDVWVEGERDFCDLFPDCERGAMPPLGPLYSIPCFVDVELERNPFIVFNAGSHEQSIKIALRDYLKLAEAAIGDFSVPR